MIYIEERKSKKVPGETSLFINFKYNKDIVNAMKNLTCKNYEKKKTEWEIPICELGEFLDNVYNIEDVTLNVLKDKKEKNIEVSKIKTKFKITPYPYQKEGIEYGLNHKKWLLLDEMGLGKTPQAILLAEELHNTKDLKHCLIICGVNSLKSNWKNEINKFSKLDSIILGEKFQKRNGSSYIGSIKDRVDQLSNKIKEFFIITNIETLRDNKVIEAIKKGPNQIDMIVVDELHTCLPYETIIDTNKDPLKIGDIVTNKIDCKIKSYNESTKKYEYKNITNFYFNGYKNNLIELNIKDDLGQNHKLICTEDHQLYTHNRGYIMAKDINEEDILEINNE